MSATPRHLDDAPRRPAAARGDARTHCSWSRGSPRPARGANCCRQGPRSAGRKLLKRHGGGVAPETSPRKCVHYLSALIRSQIQKSCQAGGKESVRRALEHRTGPPQLRRKSSPSSSHVHPAAPARAPTRSGSVTAPLHFKDAEVQDPRTFFSATRKYKSSKTPTF